MRSLALALVVLTSCGSSVSSMETAKTAYLGLDPSIDKAITLGFQGFNTAQGANISPQSSAGGAGGTITVTGQVDQGSSPNKTMRLQEALVQYSDDGTVTYSTASGSPPELDMDLKNIPTGTVTGSLVGDYTMTGALAGPVTLDLGFSSQLEAATPPDQVQRKPGTTHIVGTATAGGGTYSIDITR
jgi:hypothetical protein